MCFSLKTTPSENRRWAPAARTEADQVIAGNSQSTLAAGVGAARTHGREADGSYARPSGPARPEISEPSGLISTTSTNQPQALACADLMSPKIQAISARMAATPIRMEPRPRPPAPDAQFEAVVALEPVPTQLAAPAPMTTKPTMYRRIAPMLKMTMVRLLTRTL